MKVGSQLLPCRSAAAGSIKSNVKDLIRPAAERNQAASADMPPANAMLQIIAGARVARCVYIAAELGLADLLTDGPKGSEELAKATGTHAPSLYRVLRMLARALGCLPRTSRDALH